MTGATRCGRRADRAAEAGAALVVALVLLTVLTALAVSAASTATYEVAMAGNAQYERAAFDAAEAGIEIALARRAFSTTRAVALPATPAGDGSAETEATIAFAAVTPVPHGFSLGADGLAAFHFEIEAVGRAPRHAVAVHRQGFYVIGPNGP
ncbi:MAG TPA: PilX N-terminal domain-containing pilus assembly protein [Gammaproteobacteria bacterium]